LEGEIPRELPTVFEQEIGFGSEAPLAAKRGGVEGAPANMNAQPAKKAERSSKLRAAEAIKVPHLRFFGQSNARV
jgi:hypothetical protein